MILRVLTLAGGIIGAGVAAQGPGFSRAYVFEIEAAERTLSGVVAHFDAAASAADKHHNRIPAPVENSRFLHGQSLYDVQETQSPV